MKRTNKKNMKSICLGTFIAGIIFSGSVFGADLDLMTTKEYEEWKNLSTEQKQETMMPKTYSAKVPESILNDNYEEKVPNILRSISSNLRNKSSSKKLQNIEGTYMDSTFNLAKELELRVEHQGSTTECWAFSVMKALETNMALENGSKTIPDFSERHMDYATSRTFSDGINEKGFKREVGSGGLQISGLSYLTNGTGAVLETDMPFENNENKIALKEIDKEVDSIVTEYVALPQIHKKYTKDSSNNTTSVKYTDGQGKEYSESEVLKIRNIIKKHLVEYGAITSLTAGNKTKYYNKTNYMNATAYNCNDSSVIRDHGITIVGWDDNYSRDNFAEGTKPSKDGAYIVLNSYGKSSFDNGYLYISYEDSLIESELYGIKTSTKKDYENIYQTDFYGGIFSLGSNDTNKGYYAATFEKQNEGKQYIDSVGITIPDYVRVKIYINPINDSLEENLIEVGESEDILEPGYHRINVDTTEIVGEKFAIVIEQTSENGVFMFSLETPIENTAYALVSSERNSYYRLEDTTWRNLADITVAGGYDMQNSDVCIKAFTKSKVEEEPKTDNEISSDKYMIKDLNIYRIISDTTVSEFKKNLKTTQKFTILSDDKVIDAENEVIKTGMKLKLEDGKEYELIVRGDINLDGKVSITDLSKLLLHYNETRGFILEGCALKAGDMNCDGRVTLTDVSQMLILYNSI